jgi:hypothetical protein
VLALAATLASAVDWAWAREPAKVLAAAQASAAAKRRAVRFMWLSLWMGLLFRLGAAICVFAA